MLNRLFIALSFTILFIIHLPVHALTVSIIQTNQPKINQDTLASILQQKDYYIRQKKLINFIKNYIKASQPDELTAVQDTFKLFFGKYNLSNKEALYDFMNSMALYKQHNLKNAEAYMSRAVQHAATKEEPYLLFQFYSHLGFIQTDEGNFIGAIYNYRLATKEVAKLKDKIKSNRPQAALNINISDLYYKSGLYAESINYLDKALALLVNDELNKAQLLSVVYYNKSENYFRMNNIDSLIAYYKKLNDPDNKNYKIFTYRQRIGYYLTLLKHDYIKAINQIKLLKQNKNYVANELEDQHLADAYYMSGQLDSAKYIIDKLLRVSTENNHPEIKFHWYETLAWIAGKKGDYKESSKNYNLALNEAQKNNSRLTQVGNISSQIKIDEAESSYSQRTQVYERERLWLILTVIIAALTIVAIALIYRNVKQKRHYETLLYVAKKEELAFINSHAVRKHLTNILGIIDILQNSENKLDDYKQMEPYLLESAAKLDEAIKSISEKLND
jgi:hypothetical protein